MLMSGIRRGKREGRPGTEGTGIFPHHRNYHLQAFARRYAEATRGVDTAHLRRRFLARVPEPTDPPARILDLGCGSGRDALAFRQAGYRVDAMDASRAMAELARRHADVPVRILRAQELEAEGVYEGIWACASLLHVPWEELPDVFRRVQRALRRGGVLYASFKPGEGQRTLHDGRHFTDMTGPRLEERLRGARELRVIDLWETQDVRPERAGESWLNALVHREGL